jgi:hypothetical protein
MALSICTGPVVTTGNIDSSQQHAPEQGPNLEFQGSGLLDPRFVGTIGTAPGTPVYGLYANPYFSLVDAVPQAAAANRIAAAQTATSGTAMTLVSTQGTGVSPKIPLVPMGQAKTSANAVNVLALDFGFTTANTTSGSNSITIPSGAWKFFQAGETVIISGAGASANTPLITTVAATPAAGATTVTLSANAGQTVSNAQVGNADASGVTAWPFVQAGQIALADPAQSLARGVSVTSNNAGDTGWSVTVRGYDIAGNAMTETISVTANSIAYGKKAFKYIASVTPSKGGGGSTTGTLSIGTSDVFGFSVRSDFWEYMNIYWNGAFLTASTGWTVADASTPTATTGDVRGTLQCGTVGGGSGATGSADGSKRLAVFISLPVYNAVGATNLSYVTLFGNSQFAG